MISLKPRPESAFHWSTLLQNFLQGLVIIAPVAITLYAVLWLFTAIDNLLPGIIHYLFPNVIGVNSDGSLRKFPGFGFLMVIVILILIGKISTSFVVSRLVEVLDTVLERTPGIKFIYSSVKDFLEAFAGNKRKFDKPILVSVDASDVWRIGFITQAEAKNFEMITHAVVYIPLSYSLTGVTYIVPKEKIKLLHNVSSAEAMKFAVTGGVTEVE